MCFFSLKTCPIFNLPYVLMCRLGSKADLLVGQSLYYRMDINHICLYRLVSLMKYTKYIFIAAISVILICVALFIKTIPIYPSFQKNCSTLSEIQKNFTGAAYPPLERMDLRNEDYVLLLDGRTVESQPVGYVILGESATSEEITYLFRGRCDASVRHSISSYDYNNISISVSYAEDTKDPVRSFSVIIEFSLGRWNYKLRGSYTRKEVAVNENPNRLQMRKAHITEDMEQHLLNICYEMIDFWKGDTYEKSASDSSLNGLLNNALFCTYECSNDSV